jgi:hypothetical protein
MLRPYFVFILLFASTLANAQNIMQTQVNEAESSWSGFATSGYGSNLQERDSYDSESQTSASLMVNYRVHGTNLVRFGASGFKEMNHAEETKLNDSQLSWVNNGLWKQGKVFTIGQQIRSILPTSKESKDRDEKLLGVSVVPTFVVNLTPVGVTGVVLTYVPQLTKNFHKYETNRKFTGNTEYAVSHIGVIYWAINDVWYIQPQFLYSSSWSYQGTKKDDSFDFTFTLGRRVGKSLYLSAGVSNAGAIRDFEQGNDQTVELLYLPTSL